MPKAVDWIENRAKLKLMPTHPDRRIMFLTEPEADAAYVYRYKHGDTTTADNVAVIEPVDGKGRYFQFTL